MLFIIHFFSLEFRELEDGNLIWSHQEAEQSQSLNWKYYVTHFFEIFRQMS